MKTSELRIGNLVLHPNYPGEVLKIAGLVKDNIYLEKGYGKEELYEPIPLTEEWLLKFGFNKYSKDYGYYNLVLETGLTLYTNRNMGAVYLAPTDKKGEYNILPKAVRYVHELQNLYFTLTGEEIEIKVNA